MNRNFLLTLSLFTSLTLISCNAQRNEKLCCGHKPDPAVVELHNQTVNTYTDHLNSPDSVKKAMVLLDYAIDKDPDYQPAYAHRTECLKNQSDLIQTLETLDTHLRRNPTEPYIPLGAGVSYGKSGNKKETMDYYKHVRINFKRLYEKDNGSTHEINRCFAIRLMEGPRRTRTLRETERDRLASTEEQRKINDVLVMSIIETPRKQFFKQTSLPSERVN